jgi:hypothetical protein
MWLLMTRRKEILGLLLLLFLGLAARLVFVSQFPVIPVSDYRNLINFGLYLRTHGLINDAWWFWQSFNFGLPLVLCGLFAIFPAADPAVAARLATVVAGGLLPVLPFVVWRDLVPWRLRVATGAALAIWPGQVAFSGVVAQDNWVLFPSVALGAVAVRALLDRNRAWPVTAGVLFTIAGAMRSDMLLMLLPLLLAAIRVDRWRTRWRPVVAGGLAAIVGLLGLAAYRKAASGRFSLAPEVAGLALLGTYLPGSTINGWEPPYAFLAATHPELLRDRPAMLAETSALAIQEAMRRPGFHALRIFAMLGSFAVDGETTLLYWSLGNPEVLPANLHERAAALANRLSPLLRVELAALQALFLAAIAIGIRRRDTAVLAPASAVVVKYGLHAFGVFQGRYFLVATAIEILAIGMAAANLKPDPYTRRIVSQSLAAGAAIGLSLFFFAPRLMAFVQSRDFEIQQRTYHFFLQPSDHGADLACTVDRGTLVTLWPESDAAIRMLQPHDPAPGDRAVATCELTGTGGPRPLMLQVFDPYAPGGMGGRVVQRVALDGAEVYARDIGREPGSGWANIPLGNVGLGTKRKVVIEVEALHPEPGANWGENSRTAFRLAHSSATVHLAMSHPTLQSSTLATTATGSQAAVDGNTDGAFYHGSVTSTDRDAHAWWQVDLGSSKSIRSIAIWNRTDCCAGRLGDYWVFVSDTPFLSTDTPAVLERRTGIWRSHQTTAPTPSVNIPVAAPGRYVRIQLSGDGYLSLAEVQVFGP